MGPTHLPAWQAVVLPWVGGAATTQHVLGSAAPSLMVWATFAALAAGVSLAYANLKSFRYRDKVRDGVRDAVQQPGFMANFEQYLKQQPDGAEARYLVAMGRLWELPNPFLQEWRDKPIIFNGLFQTPAVLIYRSVFANNADKTIAISLGILDSWIIWFGTLDAWYFPTPTYGDPIREQFLAGAAMGSILVIAVGVLAVNWARRSRANGKMAMPPIAIGVLLASVGFLLASLNALPLSEWVAKGFSPHVEWWAGLIAGTPLWFANIVPLVLVLFGDAITDYLIMQAGACVQEIGNKQLSKVADTRAPTGK